MARIGRPRRILQVAPPVPLVVESVDTDSETAAEPVEPERQTTD